MNKVQPAERVVLLDATKQVDAAIPASIALDDRGRVDNGELGLVGLDTKVFTRDDADNGEQGTARLPALAAATGVVVGDVALQCDDDLVGWAVAAQRTPRKIRVAPSDAVIDEGVDGGGHCGWMCVAEKNLCRQEISTNTRRFRLLFLSTAPDISP